MCTKRHIWHIRCNLTFAFKGDAAKKCYLHTYCRLSTNSVSDASWKKPKLLTEFNVFDSFSLFSRVANSPHIKEFLQSTHLFIAMEGCQRGGELVHRQHCFSLVPLSSLRTFRTWQSIRLPGQTSSAITFCPAPRRAHDSLPWHWTLATDINHRAWFSSTWTWSLQKVTLWQEKSAARWNTDLHAQLTEQHKLPRKHSTDYQQARKRYISAYNSDSEHFDPSLESSSSL